MSLYRYNLSNDTGPRDEYYVEFYEIIDPKNEVVGRMKTEEMATLVCWALNNISGYSWGKVQCDFCSHDWIAVFHTSTEKLECPECRNMTIR